MAKEQTATAVPAQGYPEGAKTRGRGETQQETRIYALFSVLVRPSGLSLNPRSSPFAQEYSSYLRLRRLSRDRLPPAMLTPRGMPSSSRRLLSDMKQGVQTS